LYVSESASTKSCRYSTVAIVEEQHKTLISLSLSISYLEESTIINVNICSKKTDHSKKAPTLLFTDLKPIFLHLSQNAVKSESRGSMVRFSSEQIWIKKLESFCWFSQNQTLN